MRFAPIKRILLFAMISMAVFVFPSDVQAAGKQISSGNEVSTAQNTRLTASAAPTLPTSTPDVCGFGCGTSNNPSYAPANTAAGAPDGQIAYEPGVVKLILFWMEGCPHCDEIRATTLPRMQNVYGQALVTREIELETVEDVDLLFLIGDAYGMDIERIGVPFLMIGDEILSGSGEIEGQLPDLIAQYAQKGGVGYPDNPYLGRFLPVSSPAAVPTPVPEAQGSSSDITIHFFWGDGCPHCAKAKPILEELAAANPRLILKMYEVYYVPENQALFREMTAALGFEPHAVPTIIIGNQYWEGFSDLIQSQIETAVQVCLESGCSGDEPVADDPVAADPETSALGTQEEAGSIPPDSVLKLPVLGEIDLSKQSLVVSTLLIAFVDGFNPCSIWVLTMLLTITLQTKSRKKILIIGLVFIAVTAAIYALFIAGLFTVLTFVSFTGWIQVIVALAALFFALVNIKDYFWYKEGVSFTIDESKKPGIYRRIRKVLDAGESIWGLVAGTVVLAAGVSLVEFTCTAGFPVLWTNMLASQDVNLTVFIVLLLIYMLIYQLDELGIFLVAVFTLRSSKLEEKHGRILKLVGGMLMLTLAGVMLINPGAMGELSSAILVFVIAFAATLLVLLLHRYLLPRLNIHLGTEFSNQKKRKFQKRRE